MEWWIGVRDYLAWHELYDDLGSSLSRRLALGRELLDPVDAVVVGPHTEETAVFAAAELDPADPWPDTSSLDIEALEPTSAATSRERVRSRTIGSMNASEAR